MSCLFCVYYVATEPLQHRQQREAGTCPDGCARTGWTPANAMRYVKHTNTNIAGECHVGAATLQKNCTDVCGKFEVANRSAPYGLKVNPRPDGQNLHEWAREQMHLWIRGKPRDVRLEEAEQDVRGLRYQLAIARKRSAARMARIKKLEAKPPISANQEGVLDGQHRLWAVIETPMPMPMPEAAD